MLEEDVGAILNYPGYVPELEALYKLKELVKILQVKMISFEVFLATVKCEPMLEINLQAKDKSLDGWRE